MGERNPLIIATSLVKNARLQLGANGELRNIPLLAIHTKPSTNTYELHLQTPNYINQMKYSHMLAIHRYGQGGQEAMSEIRREIVKRGQCKMMIIPQLSM